MALGFYLGVSVLYFGLPIITRFSSMTIGVGDPSAFMWCLSWWPYALTHGINPFVTKVLFAPHGFNLAWVPCTPAIALIAAPLTLAVGPVVTFNIVMLIAPALSAWCAFMLCRYLTPAFVPALIGGYLFGFSSYEVAHLHPGHVNLVLTFAVPLAVLLCLLTYDGKMRHPRFVVGLAALVAFQLGVSTEILATATFFGGTALAAAFVIDHEHRGDLLRIAGSISLAYLLAAIVVMPYWYYLYKGLSNLPHVIWSVSWFSADLANYFIPTSLTRLGGSLLAPLTRRFVGNLGEQSAYLGFPVLLMMLIAAITYWKSIAGKILIVSGVVVILASLGPVLRFAGHGGRLVVLPMPWAFFQDIPVLRFALPARFTLYVTLIVSVAVALWLRSASANARTKATLAIASIVSLVPAVGAPGFYENVDVPAFFADQTYRQYLREGDIALVVPYGERRLFWQAMTGMYFRLVGGYWAVDQGDLTRWGVLDSLQSGKTFPGYVPVFRAFLLAHEVKFVIIAGGDQSRWRAFFHPFLGPGAEVGGVILYDVTRPSLTQP